MNSTRTYTTIKRMDPPFSDGQVIPIEKRPIRVLYRAMRELYDQYDNNVQSVARLESEADALKYDNEHILKSLESFETAIKRLLKDPNVEVFEYLGSKSEA
jgi:hypothetical protein